MNSRIWPITRKGFMLIGQSKSLTIIQQLMPGLDPSRLPGIDVRARVLSGWSNPHPTLPKEGQVVDSP
jgi:hypothetical protein